MNRRTNLAQNDFSRIELSNRRPFKVYWNYPERNVLRWLLTFGLRHLHEGLMVQGLHHRVSPLRSSPGGDGLPLAFLCECRGKSTDKVARPGLRGIGSFALFFSPSLEEALLRSQLRVKALSRRRLAETALLLLPAIRVLPRSRKEKLSSCFNPSLALFRHSDVGRSADRWDAGGGGGRDYLFQFHEDCLTRGRNGERVGRFACVIGHSTH